MERQLVETLLVDCKSADLTQLLSIVDAAILKVERVHFRSDTNITPAMSAPVGEVVSRDCKQKVVAATRNRNLPNQRFILLPRAGSPKLVTRTPVVNDENKSPLTDASLKKGTTGGTEFAIHSSYLSAAHAT